MYRRLLCLTTLVGLPLLSLAQTTSSRFYVGVGANLLSNVPSNSAGVPRLVGPALTAGVQFTPRLALQTGAAYHWNTDSFDYLYFTQTGAYATATVEHRSTYLSIPVLLRYTFIESDSPFHVDGLAGITVLHNQFKYNNSTLFPNAIYPSDYSSSLTKANVTLGPAVRYTLSPNLELTANSLVSAVLGDSYYKFSDRLFLNTLVGVNYTFGQL